MAQSLGSTYPLVVVTGATGRLGKQLVPELESRGARVIVSGRDTRKLEIAFPGREACTYEDLHSTAKGADLVIHLAVLNNDVLAPRSAFEEVNVKLTMRVAEASRKAGVRRMINFSSTHALDETNLGHYAATKRKAVEELACRPDLPVTTFYLPAVVGDELSGKLSALNKLPRHVRSQVIHALSALKPTVRVCTVADEVFAELKDRTAEGRIVSEGQVDNLYFGVVKRFIDLSFAVAVLVCFWWLLITLSILIRLQSKGPAIFCQERVGRAGKTFTCFKFRTMHLGTPNVGTHEAPENAVTPIGRFLRSSKLDELPQVFNILLNQVSLVGPRPCLPSQSELIQARARRGVLDVKPGITGYAQVHGVDMSEPEVLSRWDETYVRLQSLLLDIRIALATARGRGLGDRATARASST
ncbi:sugar transferase [Devosia albogilva]|uniref:Sugar transferase n=1 Tax=Devosia albogilva TaxID=429726 RepID=A0ABW5QM62_9HYPH